jgi:hypothetical protein
MLKGTERVGVAGGDENICFKGTGMVGEVGDGQNGPK